MNIFGGGCTPSLDSQIEYEIVLTRFALGLGLWCHLDFWMSTRNPVARKSAIKATVQSFCNVEGRVKAARQCAKVDQKCAQMVQVEGRGIVVLVAEYISHVQRSRASRMRTD